ncbi:MAG: hypothetical protein EOP91_01880 [Lysobacteraceae bacterium]|nr:MAG: hypothetical protein EOP91_01880 [Xanthomonadaceae bacterium]
MNMQVPSSSASAGGKPKTRVKRFLTWLAAYVLIAAAALGANPLSGETVGPFDILPSYLGWNPAEQTVEARNMERSDILDSLMPIWLEGRQQLRQGQLPLWNPLRAGGAPSLIDPTNAMLTLPFAIFAVSPDPATGFYLAVLACLVVAGLGMHYLVGRYYSPAVSLFAGISFMMSGFVTAWLFWPHMYTAMWIPWLLLAVADYVAGGRFRAVGRIAIFTALVFAGGFPFVVAIALGAALVVALCCTIEREPGNTVPNLVGVVLGLALGLGLVALPLLTLVDSLHGTDLSYRSYGSGFTLQQHARLLSWPWAQQSAHVESNMYVGMAALIAAAAALALPFLKRSSARALTWAGYFFALSGAALVFQLLPREIGGHLPVLSNNPWSRAILLLDIGLILMAASTLGWLQAHVRASKAGVALILGLCLVQFVDLRGQFKRFNGATDAALFFPVSPELEMLKQRIRPFQYVAQDSHAFMVSGTLGAIGLGEWYAHAMRSRELNGLLGAMATDPFTTPTATQIRLDRFHWAAPLLDASALCYGVSTAALERGGSRSGRSGLKLLTPGQRIVVVENPGCATGPYFVEKSSFAEPLKWSQRVRLARYRPDRFVVDVDAPSAGYLVIPMHYRNGWTARVQGIPRPIKLVGGVMPAIAIQQGPASVEMRYLPPRLLLGSILTLLALVLLVASAWRPRLPTANTLAGRGPTV